jgi:hypothetical protein
LAAYRNTRALCAPQQQKQTRRRTFHTNISLRQKREGESALKSAMVAVVAKVAEEIASAPDGMAIKAAAFFFNGRPDTDRT